VLLTTTWTVYSDDPASEPGGGEGDTDAETVPNIDSSVNRVAAADKE